ncbi:potassium channel family protein [Anoxynatronum buryatiense]|uniref:Trk system potassium uptake protein TrkA n=1 Tax=Anoxynatronum buryatiense TaxID=489973 RepID=A0AA45WT52_9CLOT|nr:TrkA family potassium uptake protein [Anoxynatronum buryatiense]SMP40733.1 trk system potassium uptake protein TrkA [Anoxynatronum buryatiense]
MKQFAVIGCGRFGTAVAKTLYKNGYDVLAIDECADIVQHLSESVTHAASIDVKDEHALRAVGMRNIDVAIIAIGSDIKASIMATLVVKELGVKYVVAKAQDELHAKVLYKIGADRVIFPERDMGVRLAYNLTSTNILDYIELAPDYSIMEITAPEKWIDKTLQEANVRSKYGLSVLAVKHGEAINVSPHADAVVRRGDVLVVVGLNDDLQKVQEKV